MRRTVIIRWIFAALLVGVLFGRWGLHVEPILLITSGVIAILALIARSRLAPLALILSALSLGLWRAGLYQEDQTTLTTLIGQKVTVDAAVADDPGIDPRGFETFKLQDLIIDGHPTPGTLTIFMYTWQVQRGYHIHAEGEVKPGYGNSVAELSYPQIQVTSRQQSWLERLRQRFFAGMRTAVPEPSASFALGLLVGVRGLVPKDMQTTLALVGLSHLVAVSGYNLTIIVRATDRLLARFGRGIALVASLWLIGGFLLVTGASASIVRASVVAVLGLLAHFYGRRFDPLALILLAAGVTAAYNPGFLTDFGWLLSFLAFYGILVLAPAIETRFHHPKPVLMRLLIESTAAQVLTIPLILYQFDQLSIVSPLANLIILPMVPLAMLLGFVAGVAGIIAPAFCGWVSWPATLLLNFMISLIDAFGALPWAGRSDHITMPVMLAMYAIILTFTLALERANKRRGLVAKPTSESAPSALIA